MELRQNVGRLYFLRKIGKIVENVRFWEHWGQKYNFRKVKDLSGNLHYRSIKLRIKINKMFLWVKMRFWKVRGKIVILQKKWEKWIDVFKETELLHLRTKKMRFCEISG